MAVYKPCDLIGSHVGKNEPLVCNAGSATHDQFFVTSEAHFDYVSPLPP